MSQVKNKFLAQMANDTVKANISGATANPSDVSAISTATASSFMVRDVNANVQANSFIESITVTATASGTTTLTVGSTENQVFTGTSTQTIVLPNATTLAVGQSFNLFNQSSVAISLEFNGGASFSDAAGRSYSSIAPYTFITVTLQTNGTAAGTWAVSSPSAMLGSPGPTVQKFLSGSGTYTTPANVAFIQVEMVGGGGGAGGSGTSAGSGGNGTATVFGTSLLTANGGTGSTANVSTGGNGGTATINVGAVGYAFTGGEGSGASVNSTGFPSAGGTGAASPFGGAGVGQGNGNIGSSAQANTGSGGGGAGGNTSFVGTGGGGAGGYIKATINSPLSSYSYSIGSGGSAGAAGTSGVPGGAGGSGVIIVTEYYYNGQSAMAGNGGAYTPTVTTLTSGSGTFTTPANASYIVVEMVGGGGGGGNGGSSSGTAATAGGTTTFGSSLLTANGGGGGGNSTVGAPGGSATIGAGATGFTLTGGGGATPGATVDSNGYANGASGGSAPFGGAGIGGYAAGGGGYAGVANTGAGGGGGASDSYSSSQVGGGSGGGAGGYIKAFINSPASTYSYAVGAGGSGQGGVGTGGGGGAGASGQIIITTYYNNGAVGTATNVTGVVAVANGGTSNTSFTPYAPVIGGTTSTGPLESASSGMSNSGYVLTSTGASSAPTWQAAGTASPLTTKGDIYTYTTTNARHAVPNDYGSLIADSAQTDGWRNTTYTQTQGKPGKNYIQYADFENDETTGWSLVSISATSGVFHVGSGGNPYSATNPSGSGVEAGYTISAISSGAISGAYSLALTIPSGSKSLYDALISDAFTIDICDQAKVMQVSFSYSATSGASNLNFSGTSSNSLSIWIYDVTNNAWIQPAGVYNLVQGSGCGKATATFQTTSNSTQYQLAVVNTYAQVGAATVLFDDFFVGPQIASMGPAMSDWQSYTPTVTNGTYSSISGQYRRIGDSMQIEIIGTCSSAGSGIHEFGIPSGYSIDTTKSSLSSSLISWANGGTAAGQTMGSIFGFAGTNNNNGGAGLVVAAVSTALSVVFTGWNSQNWSISGNYMSSSYNTWGGSYPNISLGALIIKATIPITGWSSNTVQSADTDTRVVAMNVNTTPSTIPTGTVIFSNSVLDTHAAYNASTGIYTVPISGYYKIDLEGIRSSSSTSDFFLSKNGTNIQYLTTVVGSSAGSLSASVIVECNSGNTLAIVNSTSSFTVQAAGEGYLSINRLSGPAVVQASESVNAKYITSTSQTISGVTVFNFGTKIFDSHNAFNGNTYTAPISGKYRVSVTIQNTNSTGATACDVWVNGSNNSPLFVCNSNTFLSGTSLITLNAGDTITTESDSGSTATIGLNSIYNQFCIERVGN